MVLSANRVAFWSAVVVARLVLDQRAGAISVVELTSEVALRCFCRIRKQELLLVAVADWQYRCSQVAQ